MKTKNQGLAPKTMSNVSIGEAFSKIREIWKAYAGGTRYGNWGEHPEGADRSIYNILYQIIQS
jgi:hypothetical protein